MDPRAPSSDPAPEATGSSVESESLSRALRRGEEVLGPWYRTTFPHVRRLARGFLAHQDGADDVAQDVMLHLVDSLAQWDPERPFAAWLRTVVLNRCRNHQRAAQRRRSHEDAAAAEWSEGALPSPEQAAAADELGSLIERALGVLPVREREVFVLVDLEGVAPKDAADVLEVAPSTVRAALAMARRRLREALAPTWPRISRKEESHERLERTGPRGG